MLDVSNSGKTPDEIIGHAKPVVFPPDTGNVFAWWYKGVTSIEDVCSEKRGSGKERGEEVKFAMGSMDNGSLDVLDIAESVPLNGWDVFDHRREFQRIGIDDDTLPPQRKSDVRAHFQIIDCESCGRILVDKTITGMEEEEAPKPVKKTRRKLKLTTK